MTVIHFEGSCDVCGAKIELDYDTASPEIIDYEFTDDGRMVTWIRHYATAPPEADPDCARYSSRVVEVKELT